METQIPASTTLWDEKPIFPRNSLFGSQNLFNTNTQQIQSSHTKKSEAVYATPSPRLSSLATVTLPEDTLMDDNSINFHESHLIPLKTRKLTANNAAPSVRIIQGLFGEALTFYIEEFWKRYGPPSNNQGVLKHKKNSKNTTNEIIFHNLLSWLPVSENELALAHPLSNFQRQSLSLTQPVDASRAIFLSELQTQIAFTSANNLSKPTFQIRTKVVAPSINQISQAPQIAPLNSRTATRIRFTQFMSPIVYLYISFQEGPLEIWQYGPVKRNTEKKILDGSEWSLLHRISFIGPVQWFDINNNESMICILAESSLYFNSLTEIYFQPKLVPSWLTSGCKLVSDKPLTATWIEFNRIAVLTDRMVIRLLHWDSADEWKCQGYIDMKIKPTMIPPYFKPKIEYSPVLQSLYVLLSPSALKILQIPSKISLLDIEIKPYTIHFPVPADQVNSPLNLLDFQLDSTTGGKYLAIIHQNPPYVRVYLHANLDQSKSSFNYFASCVTNLEPPFEKAVPISMSFAPNEAHSHPILAILWKQGNLESLKSLDQTSFNMQTSIYTLPPNRTAGPHISRIRKRPTWKDGSREDIKESPHHPIRSEVPYHPSRSEFPHHVLGPEIPQHPIRAMPAEAMPFKTTYRINEPEISSTFFSPFSSTNNFGEQRHSDIFQPSQDIFDDPMLGVSSNFQMRE